MAQNSPKSSIPYLGSNLTLSSRWEHSDGAVWSAWAGSSIKFYSTSWMSQLFMKIGSRTERKDRWNGETPSFAVSVVQGAQDAPYTTFSSAVIKTKTFEAEPRMLVQLWDEPIKNCHVEIVLIDWASILEIEGFISVDPGQIESARSLAAEDLILFIGDSLTCGLALERSDGGQPIPQGVLDAFPSRAVSILRERNSYPLSLEVVAYPGISLTSLDRPEDDDSAAPSENLGMADKFFHTTPWDTTAWTTRGSPRFICIALGTNDETNDVPPDLFRLTLERFIQRLSAAFPSVKAVYLVPPFRDFSEPDAGEIYQDLVSHKVTVNGLSVEVCGGINDGMTLEDTVDGLHATSTGHMILANNLAQFLAPRLAPARPEESH